MHISFFTLILFINSCAPIAGIYPSRKIATTISNPDLNCQKLSTQFPLDSDFKTLLQLHTEMIGNFAMKASKLVMHMQHPHKSVSFYQILDHSIREELIYPRLLMKMAFNRLPYLHGQEVNIILSGGLVDLWTPKIRLYAEEENININIIQLSGGLSFGRKDKTSLPPFQNDVKRIIKDHPSIFLDDSYVNGGTAASIRQAVQDAGGDLHGVFVVYEGGVGDPASLYKSVFINPKGKKLSNFSHVPIDWKIKKKLHFNIAIELTGTVFLDGTEDFSVQGKRLLSFLEEKNLPVVFLINGKMATPPTIISREYPTLNILPEATHVDVAIGNWKGKHNGDQEKITFPFSLDTIIETVPISNQYNRWWFIESALAENYFLNKLVDYDILQPVFKRSLYSEFSIVDRTGSSTVFDLRGLVPTRETGGLPTDQIRSSKVRENIYQIKSIDWKSLSIDQRKIILKNAQNEKVSFLVDAYIELANQSLDVDWLPILQNWIDKWQVKTNGWELYRLDTVRGVLLNIKNNQ